ncbi:hypothetical protein [Sulfitobacter sp. 20_GPM-1509m]|uniref:hypothetical protein n=1 Tax=Sulfitobacter sp. 20_GPM-1509m TaxID=1380367 RepID=UPI000491882F|nr:hypothetical protein [Sulfitobacter sp. 20_GPM-1509m]
MTHHTGPWAHAPRPQRQPILTPLTLLLAATVLSGLILSVNVAMTALNQAPWLTETFAVHPDCPTAGC